MSIVKANTYQDATGGSNAVFSGVASPPNSMGFRNRIINGDMRIDQRNAGASVTPANQAYTLDRWSAFQNQASKYSVQQNAGAITPPAGFSNYLGVTSLSAYSVLTGDYNALLQVIEGFNGADLAWGTASAATITISFWVRSSLTGTFGGAIKNNAGDRSYPFTYTISVANTWEQKSVTIAGDTSGTWLTNNSRWAYFQFGLGVGSTFSGTAGAWAAANYISAIGAVSVVGTSGATFYITGVQLEAGTVASPFERRDYGRELQMCQRYYYRISPESGDLFSVASAASTTAFAGYGSFPVTMRTSPTALEQSGTAANYAWNGTTSVACNSVPVFSTRSSEFNFQVAYTVASGLTAGHAGSAISDNAAAYLAWSAEL
jgi:hypothetical protein